MRSSNQRSEISSLERVKHRPLERKRPTSVTNVHTLYGNRTHYPFYHFHRQASPWENISVHNCCMLHTFHEEWGAYLWWNESAPSDGNQQWASLITVKSLVSGPSRNKSCLSVVTNGSTEQAIIMHGTSTITKRSENTPKFKQERKLEQAPITCRAAVEESVHQWMARFPVGNLFLRTHFQLPTSRI